MQIDDKWQAGESTNGPKRNFTEHNPDGPVSQRHEGDRPSTSTSLGLTPGLWYMPFAGTHYDPFFKDRQDWFVKREDGEPYETAWGGTCLDLTHPEVREYVRSVADRIVNEWGFRYLKLDGLWTGTATKQQYVNSGFKDDGIGDAVFHDPRGHQHRSLSQRPAAGARDGRPRDVHPRLQRAAEHAVVRRGVRTGRRDARRARTTARSGIACCAGRSSARGITFCTGGCGTTTPTPCTCATRCR